MTENPSAASARAPAKVGGSVAIVGAAVAALAVFTIPQEGNVSIPYRDGGGVWTDCIGHTSGVKPTDRPTPAQCHAFYVADMTAAMTSALRVTSSLAQHPGPLKAVGDLVFNSGVGHYTGSPMSAAFGRGQWAAGCNAFAGYLTLYKAPKPVPGHRCVFNKAHVLYCEAGGLVTRRLGEKKLCLSGIR